MDAACRARATASFRADHKGSRYAARRTCKQNRQGNRNPNFGHRSVGEVHNAPRRRKARPLCGEPTWQSPVYPSESRLHSRRLSLPPVWCESPAEIQATAYRVLHRSGRWRWYGQELLRLWPQEPKACSLHRGPDSTPRSRHRVTMSEPEPWKRPASEWSCLDQMQSTSARRLATSRLPPDGPGP